MEQKNAKDKFLEYLESEITLAQIDKKIIKEEILTKVLEKYRETKGDKNY